ncbi:MAG TPA: hypothetical protein QF753_16660 [Victivallales bacterium]|nr:hypothetical protein [Victivallales bacterium]
MEQLTTNVVINNEQDVLSILKQINEWYEKNLPLSPVPLIVNKAIDLIGKDFMEALDILMADKSIKAVLNTGINLQGSKLENTTKVHKTEKYRSNQNPKPIKLDKAGRSNGLDNKTIIDFSKY